MPVVRLAGMVRGKEDPRRKQRAKLLYRLFDAGWDIYNGNGDQVITLSNIQNKIHESDAFVFPPGPNLEDLFHAASLFVGFQTNDADLKNKLAIIQNKESSWDPFVELICHLNVLGTVKQDCEAFFTVIDKSRELVTVLDENYIPRSKREAVEPDILEQNGPQLGDTGLVQPDFNVCVFCSASIEQEDYLKEAYALGTAIAEKGWGCVTGAGCTGMMGQVVQGAVDGGGWTGGSNVPHIIAMEGLPEGLSEFWPRGDIYTRMEIMIERSDAFIIMPGGMGTAQELLALILLLQQNHDLMNGKHIVIVNRQTSNGNRFWDPLLAMLEDYHASGAFSVVTDASEVIATIDNLS